MFSSVADSDYGVRSSNYYRGLLEKASSLYLVLYLYKEIQAYEKGILSVKRRLEEADPAVVSLQMDGWTAHHHGYMGAIIGKGSHYLVIVLILDFFSKSS